MPAARSASVGLASTPSRSKAGQGPASAASPSTMTLCSSMSTGGICIDGPITVRPTRGRATSRAAGKLRPHAECCRLLSHVPHPLADSSSGRGRRGCRQVSTASPFVAASRDSTPHGSNGSIEPSRISSVEISRTTQTSCTCALEGSGRRAMRRSSAARTTKPEPPPTSNSGTPDAASASSETCGRKGRGISETIRSQSFTVPPDLVRGGNGCCKV
eukprot:6137669-Prymnesium_polylepis.3